MIYFFIYIILIVSLLVNQRNIGVKLCFLHSLYLIATLVLIAGLRDGVGHDTDSYGELYDQIKPLLSYESIPQLLDHWSSFHGENGFLFLVSLSKSIGASFNVFLILFTSIGFALFYLSLRYYRVNIFLSLFIYVSLYFVTSYFAQIRTGLVAAGFLFISRYICRKSFVKYLIGLLLLSIIHKISFALLPIYFIKFKLDIKRSLMVVSAAIVVQQINIFDKLSSFFQSSGAWMLFQIYNYSLEDRYISSGLPIISILFFTYFYFSSLYFAKRNFLSDHYVFALLRIYLIAFFVLIAFLSVSIVSGRLFWILSVVLVVYVPLIFGSIKNKYLKIIYILPVMLYSIIQFIKVIFIENNYMLPYKTILY